MDDCLFEDLNDDSEYDFDWDNCQCDLCVDNYVEEEDEVAD